MLQHAALMAQHGSTDAEIAEALGVSTVTLYAWMKLRPDFLNAIRSAKDIPDERVKRNLFHQAIEGNVTAQVFWLKNRRPQEWRDRHETELIVPVDDTPPEQIDVRRMALAAIALIREAPDAPMIDAQPVAQTEEPESDDQNTSYDAEDEDFDFDA
jgi:hypothetical protein